jgi:serine/threonine-protein kinase
MNAAALPNMARGVSSPGVVDDAAELLAGTAYRFVAPLGRGGMGEVVEAEHRELQKRVVIKLLHADVNEEPELAERLRFEARAMARAQHPNLVPVTDIGTTREGRTFFVMERLYGRSLRDELRERGFLPAAEAIGIAKQALAGLEAAHTLGLVHRDVKPGNIFLCQGSGVVKLIDFGIAKLVDPSQSSLRAPRHATQEGATLGTPRYIAPEQVRGEPVTPATDVYAMGLTLYEAVTGRPAFGGMSNVHELFNAQLLQMPERPSAVASQRLPAGLDAVILQAVAKIPDERFRSAHAFSRALDAVLSGDVPASAVREHATEIEDTEAAPAAQTVVATQLEHPHVFAPTPSNSSAALRTWLLGAGITGGVVLAGVLAVVLGGSWIIGTKDRAANAIELLPEAHTKAKERVPDAELVSFSASNVDDDGLGTRLWYRFRSARGVGKCKVDVHMSLGQLKAHDPEQKDCDAKLAPPPRCTLRDVVTKARRSGLPGELDVEYFPSFPPNSKAWRVQNLTGGTRLDLDDDC